MVRKKAQRAETDAGRHDKTARCPPLSFFFFWDPFGVGPLLGCGHGAGRELRAERPSPPATIPACTVPLRGWLLPETTGQHATGFWFCPSRWVNSFHLRAPVEAGGERGVKWAQGSAGKEPPAAAQPRRPPAAPVLPGWRCAENANRKGTRRDELHPCLWKRSESTEPWSAWRSRRAWKCRYSKCWGTASYTALDGSYLYRQQASAGSAGKGSGDAATLH